MNPFTLELSLAIHNERLRDAEFCRNMLKNGTKSPARSITLPQIGKAIASLSKKVTMHLHLTQSASTIR